MLTRLMPGEQACDALKLRRIADAQRPRRCRPGRPPAALAQVSLPPAPNPPRSAAAPTPREAG
ncbi:MAG TPA: hypothetical protein VH105_21305 [Burkholderiales bacterium]|jgi:hypothetical protein|nr:hypothetical protein [Burkholderiales bacterium]